MRIVAECSFLLWPSSLKIFLFCSYLKSVFRLLAKYENFKIFPKDHLLLQGKLINFKLRPTVNLFFDHEIQNLNLYLDSHSFFDYIRGNWNLINSLFSEFLIWIKQTKLLAHLSQKRLSKYKKQFFSFVAFVQVIYRKENNSNLLWVITSFTEG